MLNPPKIIILPPTSERPLCDYVPGTGTSPQPAKHKEQDKGELAGQCKEQIGLLRGHLSVACEKCGAMIRFKEYKEHLNTHTVLPSTATLAGKIHDSHNTVQGGPTS